MSSTGYIYIKNWDEYQYRSDRRLPWIKLYAELLDDDDYLALSLADRGLLQDLWKLAALSGDGRVSVGPMSSECPLEYRSKSLARRLNVRRVSLEPLIQGGWIEIRAHKRRRKGALEESETEKREEKKQDLSRNRNGHAQGTVSENTTKPELPATLTKILDAKISAGLTNEQIEVVGRAWNTSTELRHSLADIESAENPTAMLVSVAKRIAPMSAANHEASQTAKRMGAVQRCRFLWHQGIDDGEPQDALRESLEREYRHDPSIVLEAIGAQ